MSKYPTLTEVIRDHLPCTRGDTDDEIASHITTAWVRACTVTTVEALDELPDGAVILVDGAAGRKVNNLWWWWSGTPDLFEPDLPALLIWMPGWEA